MIDSGSTTTLFAQALASYDAALALAPDFAEAWNNRGVALKNMARLEASLEVRRLHAAGEREQHVAARLERTDVVPPDRRDLLALQLELAEPRHDVRSPHMRAQHRRNRNQQRVARGMAEPMP